MENKDVPYIVYEGAMARAERHIKMNGFIQNVTEPYLSEGL